MANYCFQKNIPSFTFMQNGGMNGKADEDVGINFGFPKANLSSFRIPKVKKTPEDVQLQSEKQIKELPKGPFNTQARNLDTETKMSYNQLFMPNKDNGRGTGFERRNATKKNRTFSERSTEQNFKVNKTPEIFGVKRRREPIRVLSQIIMPPGGDGPKTPLHSIWDKDVCNVAKKIKRSINAVNKTPQNSPVETSSKVLPQNQELARDLKKNETNKNLKVYIQPLLAEMSNKKGSSDKDIQVHNHDECNHRPKMCGEQEAYSSESQSSKSEDSFTLPQHQLITRDLKRNATNKKLKVHFQPLLAEMSNKKGSSDKDLQVHNHDEYNHRPKMCGEQEAYSSESQSSNSEDSFMNVSKPSPMQLKQMALRRIFNREIQKAKAANPLPKMIEKSLKVAKPTPMQLKQMALNKIFNRLIVAQKSLNRAAGKNAKKSNPK